MAKKTFLYCFSLSLVLASVSAIKTLHHIKDLKRNANLVKDFPRHGLMLLHWFANAVKIDDNEASLNFDPGQGHYGLLCYRNEMIHQNMERRPPSSERRYYLLGDLSHGSARMLPSYVTQDFHNSVGSPHRNVDRILVKVQKTNPQRVDKVYLTQVVEEGSQAIDQSNTYEVSTQLLNQIQALQEDIECDEDDPRLNFSPCEILDHHQKAAKLERAFPKTPGLAWLLTLAGYNVHQRSSTLFCSTNQVNPSNGTCYPLSTDDTTQCHVRHKIKLEVKSTSTGYTKIVWSGVPECIARLEVSVALYKDGTQKEPLKEYPLNGRTFGSIITSIPLNPGLQVHLQRTETTSYYLLFSTTHYTSIWKGPELDGSNQVLPTTIGGYGMSLQLFTKDGYACARLYVKKSFINWKNVFDNSWIGFYTSSSVENNRYVQYEWVVNFEKKREEGCALDYDVYECESSLEISPGVQGRLMLTQHIASEKARTVPWEQESTFKQ